MEQWGEALESRYGIYLLGADLWPEHTDPLVPPLVAPLPACTPPLPLLRRHAAKGQLSLHGLYPLGEGGGNPPCKGEGGLRVRVKEPLGRPALDHRGHVPHAPPPNDPLGQRGSAPLRYVEVLLGEPEVAALVALGLVELVDDPGVGGLLVDEPQALVQVPHVVGDDRVLPVPLPPVVHVLLHARQLQHVREVTRVQRGHQLPDLPHVGGGVFAESYCSSTHVFPYGQGLLQVEVCAPLRYLGLGV